MHRVDVISLHVGVGGELPVAADTAQILMREAGLMGRRAVADFLVQVARDRGEKRARRPGGRAGKPDG